MCGDPWLKNVCATNFETLPRFLVFFLHFFIAVFNVICFMFFAGRNTAGCSTKYILWILKKARRRRHFSVVGSSPKRLCPPILKIYATHLNKNNIYIYIYIVLFVLSLFYLLFCYQYYLKHVCLFSLFMFIFVLFVFNILLFCIYIMFFWFHLFPLFFIFIYCFFIYIFLITIIIITIII